MRRRGIRRDGHHPPRDTLRTQTMAIAQTAAMAISQGAPQHCVDLPLPAREWLVLDRELPGDLAIYRSTSLTSLRGH